MFVFLITKMTTWGIAAESIIDYFYIATVLQILSNWPYRLPKIVLVILAAQKLLKIPGWDSANAHSTALKHGRKYYKLHILNCSAAYVLL